MIDWNVEEQRAITNRQQKEADIQAKIEAEKQKKVEEQLQLEKNIPIFNEVINEELENFKSYLNKYAYVEIEVERGHVSVRRYGGHKKYGGYCPHDIYCPANNNIDVADWTRKQLINIAMWFTVNYS